MLFRINLPGIVFRAATATATAKQGKISGKADKKQIQQMVKLLLKMDEVPRPDDAADAIACAITHCQAGVAKKQFLMK